MTAHLHEQIGGLFIKKDEPLPSTAIVVWEGKKINVARYTIYVDKIPVGEWPTLVKAAAGLLATYYVFNLEYPRGIKKTLTFLQKCITGLNDAVKKPLPVVSFWQKLLKKC